MAGYSSKTDIHASIQSYQVSTLSEGFFSSLGPIRISKKAGIFGQRFYDKLYKASLTKAACYPEI